MEQAVARAKLLMLAVRTTSVAAVERALAAGARVDGMRSVNQIPSICLASNYGYVDTGAERG